MTELENFQVQFWNAGISREMGMRFQVSTISMLGTDRNKKVKPKSLIKPGITFLNKAEI